MTAPGLYAVVASQRAGLRPRAEPDPRRERPRRRPRPGGPRRRPPAASRSARSRGRTAGRSRARRSRSGSTTGRRGTTGSRRRRRGRDGLASFDGRSEAGSYFVAAKKGGDLALDPSYTGLWRPPAAGRDDVRARLHRPEHLPPAAEDPLEGWSPSAAGGAEARFASARRDAAHRLPAATGTARRSRSGPVKTNAYGSAAGEFAIPAGGSSGSWRGDDLGRRRRGGAGRGVQAPDLRGRR